MSFLNLRFYLYFSILYCLTLVLQFVLSGKQELSNNIKKSLLLFFSMYVMYCYDVRFCICMLAIIVVTYLCGILIVRFKDSAAKSVAKIGVSVLVLTLAYFKYFNFFVSSMGSLTGKNWNNLNIILPIGISFYTFSAISYVLDVYWNVVPCERSIFDMALFISFFPKIICGPVVRARDFLPQLKETRNINCMQFSHGIQVFVFGLFKKLVLAGNMGIFIDDIFYAPAAYNTTTVWLACLCNMIHLYFDFSGYSDMAIGITEMLGYDFKRNFNLPFLSTNISTFWNRWHISLTTWLNDYIFNPIAVSLRRILADKPKNIRSKYKLVPECIAVIITFFVSGIWHGVGYTFIFFGLMHGGLSVIQKIYASKISINNKEIAKNKSKIIIVVNILLNFISISLIQVLFRADSLHDAVGYYSMLFTIHEGINQPGLWAVFGIIVLVVSTVIPIKRVPDFNILKAEGFYPVQDLTTIKGLTIFFIMIGLTIVLGYYGNTYFAYGRF